MHRMERVCLSLTLLIQMLLPIIFLDYQQFDGFQRRKRGSSDFGFKCSLHFSLLQSHFGEEDPASAPPKRCEGDLRFVNLAVERVEERQQQQQCWKTSDQLHE